MEIYFKNYRFGRKFRIDTCCYETWVPHMGLYRLIFVVSWCSCPRLYQFVL